MKLSHIYEKLCKTAGKSELLSNFQEPPKDLQKNLELTNLNVSPHGVIALAYMGLFLGTGIVGVALSITLIIGSPITIALLVAPLPILFYFFVGWYPKNLAEKNRNEDVENFPRLLSYLTVALKINPNLEKATSFATGKTKISIGDSFRDEIWKANIGYYSNVEEALSIFSGRWKNKNEELKRSLDLVKSSISEKDDETRKQVLDRALKTGFEGFQNRMEKFATGLQLPTTVIYGIGILLPLILLAVLPVISSTGFSIGGFGLAMIYCVFLPAIVYVLEKQVLSGRPVAFSSSRIPSNYDKRKAIMISIFLVLGPSSVAVLLDLSSSFLVLTFLWSLVIGISVFCFLSSKDAFRIRKSNRDLEDGFCDALMQLGNQLKNNHPAEYAFQKTAEITQGSEISKVLTRTSINLKAGGVDTFSAFFDPREGALREVYSEQVRHTFRILVDLLNRSTVVAGEALEHIAEHLERLEKTENRIRRSLQDIVNSMRSVALFFGPLVASITVQLQRLILDKTQNIPFFGTGLQVSPSFFLGILGFYIVILTVLLNYYIVEIKWGDDKIMKRMTLVQALPISMGVFTMSLLIGGQLLSILIG